MKPIVVLCTDGSDASVAALAVGLPLVGPAFDPVVVTVTEPADPTLLTGTGMAGGTVSPEVYATIERERHEEAHAMVERVAAQLGLQSARTEILDGRPGPALCTFAASAGAQAMLIGTRGHGGLRRAVLGSVSDHVVRHAPCPVLVARPPHDEPG